MIASPMERHTGVPKRSTKNIAMDHLGRRYVYSCPCKTVTRGEESPSGCPSSEPRQARSR
jgi:hypothetical protein